MAVGFVLEKKVGDYVKQGDVLAYMHANDLEKAKVAEERFLKAYTISDKKPDVCVVIKDIIK